MEFRQCYTASKVSKNFRGRLNSMLGGQERVCGILGATLGECIFGLFTLPIHFMAFVLTSHLLVFTRWTYRELLFLFCRVPCHLLFQLNGRADGGDRHARPRPRTFRDTNAIPLELALAQFVGWGGLLRLAVLWPHQLQIHISFGGSRHGAVGCASGVLFCLSVGRGRLALSLGRLAHGQKSKIQVRVAFCSLD